MSIIEYFFSIKLLPSELSTNINEIINKKIYEKVNNEKHCDFGIIKKLEKIKNIVIGTINSETYLCDVKIIVDLSVIIPKIKMKLKTTITETTMAGYYCVDDSKLMNIFVVPNNGKQINDTVNIELIKCKFQNEKWILIGKEF